MSEHEHKHEHNFKCPICGSEMGAETEQATIKLGQQHAKATHMMDLNSDMAKTIIVDPEKAKMMMMQDPAMAKMMQDMAKKK